MSELVKPKGEPYRRRKKNKVINNILKILEEYAPSDLQEMRNSMALVKYICNLVESLSKKKYKLNKKQIVLDIMKRIIPNFTANDEKIASDNIEEAHENGDIQKIKMLEYAGKYGIAFLKYLIPIPKIT